MFEILDDLIQSVLAMLFFSTLFFSTLAHNFCIVELQPELGWTYGVVVFIMIINVSNDMVNLR